MSIITRSLQYPLIYKTLYSPGQLWNMTAALFEAFSRQMHAFLYSCRDLASRLHLNVLIQTLWKELKKTTRIHHVRMHFILSPVRFHYNVRCHWKRSMLILIYSGWIHCYPIRINLILTNLMVKNKSSKIFDCNTLLSLAYLVANLSKRPLFLLKRKNNLHLPQAH